MPNTVGTKPEVWAGIVRVSSVGGRSGDSFHSDEDQVADVKRYAKQHGSKVVFMEPELSVSGGKPIEERPSLLSAIEGVESGAYDGIVVAYLSRLSRSRSGLAIWDRVEQAGGHVHCASEGVDTSTPSGRFIRDIHLSNATREREEHMDRFAERRQKTVESGVWRQRQTPRGLTFKGPADAGGNFRGEARKLVPGPDAEEVRQAFRDRGTGEPIGVLARRLGMTHTGLRKLLRNRVYLGELHDGENVNVAAHEPLVTVEEFEAAQTSIARPARSEKQVGPALLSGLLRCAGCGHRMSRKTATESIYACRVNHGRARCPEPAAITSRILDAYVEPIALAELARLELISSEGRGLALAEAEVTTAERELSALLKAVTAAGLDSRDYAAELRERKSAVDRARENLRAERARQPVLGQVGRTGADAWKTLDATARNVLLQSLLSGVIVARAGKGRRVPLADRVRVVAFGADVDWLDTRHGDRAAGIVPIALPMVGAPGVLTQVAR